MEKGKKNTREKARKTKEKYKETDKVWNAGRQRVA